MRELRITYKIFPLFKWTPRTEDAWKNGSVAPLFCHTICSSVALSFYLIAPIVSLLLKDLALVIEHETRWTQRQFGHCEGQKKALTSGRDFTLVPFRPAHSLVTTPTEPSLVPEWLVSCKSCRRSVFGICLEGKRKSTETSQHCPSSGRYFIGGTSE